VRCLKVEVSESSLPANKEEKELKRRDTIRALKKSTAVRSRYTGKENDYGKI